jgi:acyl-CoA hydrolase
MIVGIRAESTNIKSGEITHSNTAFFTMNMKSENDQDRVPGLILQSQEDIRRFAEGLYMKQIGSEKRKILKSDFSEKTTDEIMEQISSERIIIELN